MKTIAIKGVIIPLFITWLCLLFLVPNSAVAQNNSPKNVKTVKVERAKEVKQDRMGAKLTDEQQAKMKELRLANTKAVQLLKAQSAELAAHLKLLNLAEKPDNKAIFKTIDEMMAARGEIMKKELSYKQAMQALLTPEQLKELKIRELNRNLAKGLKDRKIGPQGAPDFKRKMIMQHMQKNRPGQMMQRGQMSQGPMLQGQMRSQGPMMNRQRQGMGDGKMMPQEQMQRRFQIIKEGQPKVPEATDVK